MRAIRLAIVVFLLSAGAFAQSEGIAEFQGSTSIGPGQSIPSRSRVLFTKAGARVEVEVDMSAIAGKESGASNGFKMTMIQKASEPDRMYMLNDAQKTYSVTNLGKGNENASTETFKVQKMGQDHVAGFSCEKVAVTSSSGSQSEMCITRQLVASAAWLAAMNRRGAGAGLWKALRDNGIDGFPIRIENHAQGGTTSHLELVRFQKTSVPASSFEIPAGYKETASNVPGGPDQRKSAEDARRKAMAAMTPEQRKQLADVLRQNLDKAPPEQRHAIEAQIKELESNQ